MVVGFAGDGVVEMVVVVGFGWVGVAERVAGRGFEGDRTDEMGEEGRVFKTLSQIFRFFGNF